MFLLVLVIVNWPSWRDKETNVLRTSLSSYSHWLTPILPVVQVVDTKDRKASFLADVFAVIGKNCKVFSKH